MTIQYATNLSDMTYDYSVYYQINWRDILIVQALPALLLTSTTN